MLRQRTPQISSHGFQICRITSCRQIFICMYAIVHKFFRIFLVEQKQLFNHKRYEISVHKNELYWSHHHTDKISAALISFN